MGADILLEYTLSVFGIAITAIQLHYEGNECNVEPMIPVWVKGKQAVSTLNPE